MPITDDRLARLRHFGLSEYGSRAYLALLDLGCSEARDISTLSKVPTSKIYHTLEQLHDKGLVVILPESPKKYVPVPFEEFINRLQGEHEEALRAIEAEREDLVKLFSIVGNVEVGDQGNFTVVRGRRNVLSKILEMISGAKREVLAITTPGMSHRYEAFLSEIKRLGSRGVRMRFLAPLTKDTLPRFAALADVAELRARELVEGTQSSNVAIVVVDSSRAFLIHFVPDDGSLYMGKDVGIYTDHEAMVSAIEATVEPHWARASSYRARAEEIRSGRVSEFTRFYTTQSEAWTASHAALERGAADVRYVESAAARLPAGPMLSFVERLQAAGARYRSVLNFTGAEVAEAYLRLSGAFPGCELRHAPQGALSRYWIVDEREAFHSLARVEETDAAEAPERARDLVVHTTEPAVVESMSSHFEKLWRSAVPLDERRRELAAYPRVRPRDLGIQRLFESAGDAVVVMDANGAIVLWNSRAGALFGYDAAEATALPSADALVTDAAKPRFREVLRRALDAGAESEPREGVEVTGVAQDGREMKLEMTLVPLAEPDQGGPYLLALVRDRSGLTRVEVATPGRRSG